MIGKVEESPANRKYVKRLSLLLQRKAPHTVKLLFAMALGLSRSTDNRVG
jgi:hypothetical protein